MGRLTGRYGGRRVAAAGALIAVVGTLPLVFLAYHGLITAVLAGSLFVRGVGLSAIGIPSLASGYASMARRDLPMATTAMNIVQRIGGPTLTTLCAVFLDWRLAATPGVAATSGAFAMAFVLLGVLHALLFVATLRLPRLVDSPTSAPVPLANDH